MSDFERALAIVLRSEGGYVNDPDDPGGATNKGVIQRTYNAWLRSKGRDEQDVHWIPMSDVIDIYHEQFWLVAGCEELEWPMDLVVFDTAVNEGYGIAMRVARATDADAALEMRREIYNRLAEHNPNLSKYLAGWMNRLDALRRAF